MNFLIPETYLELPVTEMDTHDLIDDNHQFFGGLIASTEHSSQAQEISSAEHTSESSSESQNSSHATKAGVTTSQRGRPRLISKNQSAGEVGYVISKHINPYAEISSVDAHRYDLPKEHTGSERKPR